MMANFNFSTEPGVEVSHAEIALMYSGGLDTTVSAAILAKRFKRVHLITFDNGVCIRKRSSLIHVADLKNKFGEDKFIHKIISSADLFAKIRKGIWGYFRQYNSPLVFDLCCRLSMETALVIYCLKNNIQHAADSNNVAQDAIFLQQADYLKIVDNFFKGYGINLIHPVYDHECRLERMDKLKSLGLQKGYKILEKIGITSQLFNQPFCLWAPLSFFFTSWTKNFPLVKKFTLPSKKAFEFRADRERIAKKCIQEYFKGTGNCSIVDIS
jgi:hypothetical protein